MRLDDPTGDPVPSAPPQTEAPADREDRLLAAVNEYTAAVQSGGRPNRREWLARYPDLTEDLSACLDGLAFLNSAAAQIPGAPVPPEGSASEEAALGPGRPLGDFRLVREIGRGGMGVVYEAVQISLDRRVAVKVLPLASALDTRQLQRFRNEAQAAAQLHHTNIVPIYAVGCERSVHFYAMQLIEGPSLAEVIRDLRHSAGRADARHSPEVFAARGATANFAFSSAPGEPIRGSEPLTSAAAPSSLTVVPSADAGESGSSLRDSKGATFFRMAARLGLQAAEALHYAHRAGVVHRDIKPANLLLDPQGTVWVTDFGLAQFYADSGLTQTGDLVGTLRYMSPEQASGRAVVLDQRTDVYSLGVTLYELLTLERAVTGETREQLLRALSSADPRPARAIDKTIPAELETILGKAIAKDPADRYPSALALAEDLRRFLDDEPILARPPSLWDQTVKWTRRHRSLTRSALVILLLAAVGFLTSTLLIAREQGRTRIAYERQRDEAAEARRQKANAERSFGQARDAVNFLSRVAADELADSPASFEVRKEMLEAALDYYEGFVQTHGNDDSTGQALAEARSYTTKILAELSAFENLDRVQTWARLLAEPAVQQELKLTPTQVTQVQPLKNESTFGGRRGDDPGGTAAARVRGLSSEQKRRKYAKQASQLEAAIDAPLTPPQRARLRQIGCQLEAPASFTDAPIVDALSLSREQKETIRRVQAQFRIGVRSSLGPAGPPDLWEEFPEDPSRAQQVRRSKATSEIMAQLTPAQRERWQTFVGAPFAGQVALHIGPFGPGGRGEPGGPQGHDHHGGPGDHDDHGHFNGPGGPGGDDRPDGPKDHGPPGNKGPAGPKDHGPPDEFDDWRGDGGDHHGPGGRDGPGPRPPFDPQRDDSPHAPKGGSAPKTQPSRYRP